MSHTFRKHFDYYEGKNVKHQDVKPWYKPPKGFKKSQKKIRKAKEKRAFREGKDVPEFPNSDVWDWN